MSSWSVMEEVLCRIGRAHRGLRGDHSDGGRSGPEPESKRRAEAPAEDGGGAAILLRDAKRARQMDIESPRGARRK